MKTASPSLAVPLPGGRPLPSGPMLMSQEARSSGEIGLPRLGDSANAVEAKATSAPATMSSRIDMLHLALVGDVPARDHVVVVVAAVAAQRNELGTARLYVAGLVGRTAHQRDGLAVPPPRHPEPRQRLRQHR